MIHDDDKLMMIIIMSLLFAVEFTDRLIDSMLMIDSSPT